ncbi:tripartite tricarboxylate transporter permease [Chelativorans sp. AA-79]|uniref:tripartite tricarboxylate transporter permease n=1 Tax=Chelativorans sp. AA-79 TaxID=3028735 RepID=UPI0023F996B3|nr:tripartite tricarboxylate transporter permease [Chelativorans sp. AA-79]WEX12472.1 tripartite tricarboxylate transporter permease [Chelativorans sp. AA-79]
MAEFIGNLGLGLATALTLQNLAFVFIGTLLGTLIGVLPGIGVTSTIAMLLPLTFYLPPEAAIIMLAGIYYGAMYGGSTTAILVNVPGESASVVTTIDGYQMARQGHAGAALAVAALGSLFAGTVGTLCIALFAPPLVLIAQQFGAAENFALMVLGLTAAIVLANGALDKAVAMILLGLIFGLVGTDVNSGALRFTFEIPELSDGFGFVALSMGLFGLTEVISNTAQSSDRSVHAAKVGRLWLSREDVRQATPAVLRGTALGCVLGVLPGGGALLSAFAAYSVEKKLAKDPSRFGKGAIEGVAAPESANNAGSQTSFIPMLTLGIPANVVMALMLGAMMMHGIHPGPRVMTERPELFWGLVASMWIGNIILVIINLPLIGLWVKLLTIPYRFLFPAILLFCAIGAFASMNSVFEIVMLGIFGLFGYILHKFRCEPAPLILAFILGPMMEENFRRAMLLSRGDFSTFLVRPISLVLLLLALALLLVVLLPRVRRTRKLAFEE